MDPTRPRDDPMPSVQERRLGVLRDALRLTADEVMAVRAAQAVTGGTAERAVRELELRPDVEVTRAVARSLGLDFTDLADVVVDPVLADLLSEGLSRRLGVLVIGEDDDGTLVVATSDPGDVVALDDVRSATGRAVRTVMASRADVAAALDRQRRSGGGVELQLEGAGGFGGDDDDELDALRTAVDDAPLVKFVNAIVERAVRDRASDIHIEPRERDTLVRYRIDGVLQDVTTQHRRIHAGVVSRLKIMADLDIAERRVPQDGRISLQVAGRPIDLRVSTLPTVYGEKVVMRILDKQSILLELADLGFLPATYERFQRSFRKPYGMILVTGPTGSGKSTTLYATLNVINRPEVNVVTVEDPVEYRLAGVNQVQVHPRAGLTFPGALRAILRQDPDIVLVGEMRDRETAQMGMEAALTGHLVLSTLHTNDAPSAVTRLSEMGIDPFLVSSSVDCVLAQRLARRLCRKCRAPHRPGPAELLTAGLDPDREIELFRAVGCPACAGTGYRGRLALHEVMVMTDDLRRLLVERAPLEEVARVAHAQGMLRLRDDGLEKAAAGHTTLEEIARVVV